MKAVDRLFHHATRKHGVGHTILKVCLRYCGATTPCGNCLSLKPHDARKLARPFLKLVQLVAMVIQNAGSPGRLKVIVLFDCYHLCPVVVDARQCNGWQGIGAGMGNLGERGQEPFLGVLGDFLGRPRGRRVAWRPSFAAIASTHLAVPNGRPRAMQRARARSSSAVWGGKRGQARGSARGRQSRRSEVAGA